jgi:hypothetical protein
LGYQDTYGYKRCQIPAQEYLLLKQQARTRIGENLVYNGQRFGGYWFEQKRLKYNDKTCVDDVCYDTALDASRGICYDFRVDKSFDHGVACDIPEVECCGYPGCGYGPGSMSGAGGSGGSDTNRGRWPNGTSHGYYWYPPDHISQMFHGQRCCLCAAGCRWQDEQNCTQGYYDVTTFDCNRQAGMGKEADSYGEMGSENSYGYKKCTIPPREKEALKRRSPVAALLGVPVSAEDRSSFRPSPAGKRGNYPRLLGLGLASVVLVFGIWVHRKAKERNAQRPVEGELRTFSTVPRGRYVGFDVTE